MASLNARHLAELYIVILSLRLRLSSIFLFRFVVEFFKAVQEPWELRMVSAIGLNQGQLLSIPFVVLGLYCMLGGKWCRRLGERPAGRKA